MDRVFLDASALVPMVSPADQWRDAYVVSMRALEKAGRPAFLTSNWTLYEAMAIAARFNHQRAKLLFDQLSRARQVVPVSEAIETEAVRRFLAWTDSGASIVDHANLLVAQANRCSAILSFDSDFARLARTAGIRLIGPPLSGRLRT